MRGALRAAGEWPAAVWIAHDLETLPLALRARERLGGRVLYDSHELFVESSLARWEGRRWARIERRTIGRADAVVTVSGSIAAELARRYGIPEPQVILNAPDAPDPDGGEPVDLRREFAPARRLADRPLPRRDRPAPRPGAADRGRRRAAGPRGGDARAEHGRLPRRAERLAAEHDVTERVRFLPPVAPRDIHRHAAGADVGLATSRERSSTTGTRSRTSSSTISTPACQSSRATSLTCAR